MGYCKVALLLPRLWRFFSIYSILSTVVLPCEHGRQTTIFHLVLARCSSWPQLHRPSCYSRAVLDSIRGDDLVATPMLVGNTTILHTPLPGVIDGASQGRGQGRDTPLPTPAIWIRGPFVPVMNSRMIYLSHTLSIFQYIQDTPVSPGFNMT